MKPLVTTMVLVSPENRSFGMQWCHLGAAGLVRFPKEGPLWVALQAVPGPG